MGIEEYLYFKNIAQRRNLKRFRVMQVTTILLLAINFPTANSNSDWIESCSSCHCNWNSGKKTADCKQKSLTSLPHDMSSEIQVIDLSNNRIAELQRDEFMEANFQNLHKLYMRSCTIKKINRDAFKGLGILIELDLSHNSINVLHTGTFSGLTKLRNVVINHNEIEVLNDYMFDSLPFLLRVELKFNRLKHIGIFAFRHLPYLTAVDLEGNKLRVLRKETFARFPKLISLSLAQNLWNCSCDLKEFRDFTIANRLYTPPTNCNDPPHMRSKLWNEISSNDFACKPCILSSIPAFVEVYSDNITLPCHIEGFPYPNVTWMFNKRLISPTDDRLKILNSYEQNQSGNPAMNVVTSELQIYGVKSSDNGFYTCVAENRGGRAEADFKLFVNGKFFNVLDRVNSSGVIGATASDMKSNIFFVICLILTVFLILIIIVVLLICWYCGGMRYNKKDDIINSPNGFISTKTVRTRNHFSKDGPVIMEMQKSLLNEINPVEKPPRRVDANDGCDDGLGITKTLLMDTKLNGCHIEIRPAKKDASDYINYKGWYSMVLLALVDYRFRFMYINVGAPGRCHDSQIFEKSSLKRLLEESPLLKEKHKAMNGVSVPVVAIGDSAFRLSSYVMKPYPFSTSARDKEKIFNYHLSKARRVVENAFGHLKARFRRIGKGIDNNMTNATAVIKCCCVLHNFLNEHNDNMNNVWLQNQQRYESESNLHQPETTSSFIENVSAENIRNAIATLLGSEEVFSASSGLGGGIEEQGEGGNGEEFEYSNDSSV